MQQYPLLQGSEMNIPTTTYVLQGSAKNIPTGKGSATNIPTTITTVQPAEFVATEVTLKSARGYAANSEVPTS